MGVVLEIKGFWIKQEGVADACWIRISGMLSAVMHVMDNPMDWVVILDKGSGEIGGGGRGVSLLR